MTCLCDNNCNILYTEVNVSFKFNEVRTKRVSLISRTKVYKKAKIFSKYGVSAEKQMSILYKQIS